MATRSSNSGYTGSNVVASRTRPAVASNQEAYYQGLYGEDFWQYYQTALNELKGTEFESQLPSLDMYEYSPNLWQQLMSWMGDDSAKAKFYNESKANLKEQIDRLLETKRQQEYNSESQQVARQKAAGINPALTGSVQGSQAADVPDQTPDTVPAAEPMNGSILGSLTSIAGLVRGGVSTAASIIQAGIEISKGIEDLNHTQSENSISEVQETMDSVPGVIDFLTKLTPSHDWTDPATGDLVKAGTPLQAAQVSAYVDSLGLRPRASKLLKSLAGKVRYDENGNPTTGYQAALNKLTAGSLEDMQRSVGVMSSPGFQQNMYAWSAKYNELVGELNKEILVAQKEAMLEIAKYDAKMHNEDMAESDYVTRLAGNEADQALAEFNEEYYNKLSPEAAAGLQNDNARTQFVANVQARMESRIEQAYLRSFDQRIQQVKDMHLPPQQEAALLSGIYKERNDYLTDLQVKNTEKLTKAQKTIGDVDYLNAGASAFGDAIKGIGSLSGFRKGKKSRKSYSR